MRQHTQRQPLQRQQQEQYRDTLLKDAQLQDDGSLMFDLRSNSPASEAELAHLRQLAALNQEWQENIAASTSWEALAAVAEQHVHDFNYLTLSKLVFRVGLVIRAGRGPFTSQQPCDSNAHAGWCVRPGAEDQAARHERLLTLVTDRTAQSVSWFTAREYAEVAFGLAAAGWRDRAFWAVYAASSERTLVSASPRHLALLITALATAGHTPTSQWLKKSEGQMLKHWATVQPSDLWAVAWAWGRCCYTPTRRLVEQLFGRALVSMRTRQITSVELLHVLYFGARLSQHHPRPSWLHAWCAAYAPHMTHTAPGVLADVLLCLASLQHTPAPKFTRQLLRRMLAGPAPHPNSPPSPLDTETSSQASDTPALLAGLAPYTGSPAVVGQGLAAPRGVSQQPLLPSTPLPSPSAGYRSATDMLGAAGMAGEERGEELELSGLGVPTAGSSDDARTASEAGDSGSFLIASEDAPGQIRRTGPRGPLLPPDTAIDMAVRPSDVLFSGQAVDDNDDEAEEESFLMDEDDDGVDVSGDQGGDTATWAHKEVGKPSTSAVLSVAQTGIPRAQRGSPAAPLRGGIVTDNNRRGGAAVGPAPHVQQRSGAARAGVRGFRTQGPVPSTTLPTAPTPILASVPGGVPVLLLRPERGMVPDLATCGPMACLSYPPQPGVVGGLSAGHDAWGEQPAVAGTDQGEGSGSTPHQVSSSSNPADQLPPGPDASCPPTHNQLSVPLAQLFEFNLQTRQLGPVAWSAAAVGARLDQAWVDTYCAQVLGCLPHLTGPTLVDVLYGLSALLPPQPHTTWDSTAAPPFPPPHPPPPLYIQAPEVQAAVAGSQAVNAPPVIPGQGVLKSATFPRAIPPPPSPSTPTTPTATSAPATSATLTVAAAEATGAAAPRLPNPESSPPPAAAGGSPTLKLPPSFLPEVCAALEAQMGALEPDAMSQTVVALARLGHSPGREWLQRVESCTLPHLPAYHAWALPDVAAGLVALGHAPSPEWWDRWEAALLPLLPTCPATHVYRVAWCTAAARHKPPIPWLHQLLVTAHTLFKRMTHEELVGLIWCMARLRHRPGDRWLHAYTSELSHRIGLLTPQQLADACWGLAAVSYKPSSPWLAQVEAACMARLCDMSPHHVAVILWAFNEWKHRPDLRVTHALSDACDPVLT